MYVQCYNCNWTQDDFWDEGYNPIVSVYSELSLFTGMLYSLPDSRFLTYDIGFIKDRHLLAIPDDTLTFYHVDYKSVLVERLKEITKRVENMKWWTYNDYKADKNLFCPICKSNNIGVD